MTKPIQNVGNTQTDQSPTVDLQVLQNILSNLVTSVEGIKITREINELGVTLYVSVDASDMGIVIGRNGGMAMAINTLMRAIGKANNMNIRVQFLEPDGTSRYSREPRTTQPQNQSKPLSEKGDLVLN